MWIHHYRIWTYHHQMSIPTLEANIIAPLMTEGPPPKLRSRRRPFHVELCMPRLYKMLPRKAAPNPYQRGLVRRDQRKKQKQTYLDKRCMMTIMLLTMTKLFNPWKASTR